MSSPENARRAQRKKTAQSPSSTAAFDQSMMNPYVAQMQAYQMAAFYQMGYQPGYPMPPWGFGMDPSAQPTYPGMRQTGSSGYRGAGGKGSAQAQAKGKGKGADGKGGVGSGGKGKAPQKQEEDESPKADPPEELDPNMCETLKAFRTGAKTDITPDELLADILEFARDRVGHVELLSFLDSATGEQKAKVFASIVPEAKTLSCDSSGCQVVQKLFDVGDGAQRKGLIAELRGSFLPLTKDPSGCRVMQAAIEYMSKEALLALAAELEESVSDCIYSMHGNHVVQKCIEQMHPDTVQFIKRAVETETEDLVVHRYGCRVIQRLLEHCPLHHLETMLDQICEGASRFAKDPYGNYVVQHTLQHGREQDKKRILKIITHDIVDFSIHKCSSNVVDKCVEVSTVGEHALELEEEHAALVKSILGEEGKRNPPLVTLMTDRFGCHIVGHLLEYCRGPERDELVRRLRTHERRLKQSAAGRRLLASLGPRA
jgi:pumilio RNA-binding family